LEEVIQGEKNDKLRHRQSIRIYQGAHNTTSIDTKLMTQFHKKMKVFD